MKKIMFLIALSVFLTHSQADAASVTGHFRRDGTYVSPHIRTNPDRNPYNNYNFPGNYNPNTGRITPGNPDAYLDRYYNRGRSSGGLGGLDNYDLYNPYRAR
ncbi:MAG: hypothetical protein ACREQA_24690 [Candidatus Binatia bacterium]